MVLIIIALYVLFLGDTWASSLPNKEGANALADSWIMAGLRAVTSITTVMGAFGTMVDDRARKIVKDLSASPMPRGHLAGGYVLSSYIVGVLMTVLTFILAEVYIVSRGGALLSAGQTFEVLGLILLSALCNTAMVSLLVSFMKSQAAFGTASSILGTLIGFLTGIYVPVGILPEAVQTFIKIFPVSHAALLIRQVLAAGPMETVFAGAPPEVREAFRDEMGMVFRLGGAEIPKYASLLILAGAAVLFYALAILRFSRKSR